MAKINDIIKILNLYKKKYGGYVDVKMIVNGKLIQIAGSKAISEIAYRRVVPLPDYSKCKTNLEKLRASIKYKTPEKYLIHTYEITRPCKKKKRQDNA